MSITFGALVLSAFVLLLLFPGVLAAGAIAGFLLRDGADELADELLEFAILGAREDSESRGDQQ